MQFACLMMCLNISVRWGIQLEEFPLEEHTYKEDLGPDLQNILRQSYDYLMIVPKLRSTSNGQLIYKTSYERARLFLSTVHLQNHKIVWDSVHEVEYNIPNRNLSTS